MQFTTSRPVLKWGGSRALGLALVALLGACESPHLGPTGSASPGDGRVIAMGGGPQGPAAACFTCHGLDGQGDGAATPRLAALEAGYLEKQLHDYAMHRRPDDVMAPISEGLSIEQRRAVANYYAALPLPLQEPEPFGPRERLGERLYEIGAPERGLPPCRECHGAPFEGLGLANPALGGQPKVYTVNQLHRWQMGRRRNDPLGVMVEVAQSLTEPEIDALGAYLAAVTPP